MKKLIYLFCTIALLVTATSAAFSQTSNHPGLFSKSIFAQPAGEVKFDLNQSKGNSVQAIKYNGIAILNYGTTFYSIEETTPITYDAKSNAVYIVFSDMGTQNWPVWVKRQVLSTTTWDSLSVFYENERGVAYPSITVSNFENKTALKDVPFTVIGKTFDYHAASTNYQLGTGGYIINYSDGQATADFLTGPTLNNPGTNNTFDNMKMKSYLAGNDAVVFAAGQLTPASETIQFGSYGFLTATAKSTTLSTSSVPNEWGLDKYKVAPQLTTTFNSKMEFDIMNGKFYTAVNNLFVGNDTYRVPGVSKSDNYGDSWKPFNQMPYSLLNTYATDNGFKTAMPGDPYKMNGFAATGDDQYSFVEKLILVDEAGTKYRSDLVEFYCKGTNWGVRKIKTLSNSNPFTFTVVWDSISTDRSKCPYFYSANPLGNEIQLSKTQDGKYLICKWIDCTFKIDVPDFNVLYMNQNNQRVYGLLDSIETTDVFTCVRSIGGNENWASPVNITNDSSFDKNTNIPDVVPNLNQIPLVKMSLEGLHYTQATYFPNKYADIINNANHSLANVVYYTTITAPNDVNDEQSGSVNLVLNNAFPNPATDNSEISFILPFGGNTSLAIYNSLGQKVQNVISSTFLETGSHAVNVPTNSLPDGVYYFNLTFDGKSYTKPMNVVK